MQRKIPPAWETKTNAPVLPLLTELSAHSDVGEALLQSVKPLGDVQVFCANAQEFKCIAVATLNVIFGLAVGMNGIRLRLDPIAHSRALKTGAEPAPDLGLEWASFQLFRADWPAPDLAFWLRKAYSFARESGSK